MTEKRKAIYIPAYSDGILSMLYSKTDEEVKQHIQPDMIEKKSLRIYNDSLDTYFKYPWMLVSAGIFYTKDDLRKKIKAEKAKVFVDSGGYQLARGTVPAEIYTDKVALEWSEKNGDIFPILDRPSFNTGPDKPLKSYAECLEKSIASAKYYTENRTRSDAKILNVLQGQSEDAMEKWYNKVKDFKLDGWGIGGTQGNINRVIAALRLLHRKGELKDSKYVHIFGVSSSEMMLLLDWTQRVLNSMDIDIQLTYDATSWNRAAVFGGIFLYPNLVSGIQQLQFTNQSELGDSNLRHLSYDLNVEYSELGKEFRMPCDDSVIFNDIKSTYDMINTLASNKDKEITFRKFNILVGYHNLHMQLKYIDMVNNWLDNAPKQLQKIVWDSNKYNKKNGIAASSDTTIWKKMQLVESFLKSPLESLVNVTMITNKSPLNKQGEGVLF
jgi:hypothetical protein